jgi:chemotaxis signal transduction protein
VNTTPDQTNPDERPWLLFSLGQERYALPLTQAQRVLVQEPVTSLPGAPPSILGVRNYQGRLLPVLDTAHYLGVRSDAPPQHVLVVQHDGVELGCLVTRVENIVQFSAAPAQGTTTAGPKRRPCVSGQTYCGQQLVGLLDVPELIREIIAQ